MEITEKALGVREVFIREHLLEARSNLRYRELYYSVTKDIPLDELVVVYNNKDRMLCKVVEEKSIYKNRFVHDLNIIGFLSNNTFEDVLKQRVLTFGEFSFKNKYGKIHTLNSYSFKKFYIKRNDDEHGEVVFY